MKQMKVVEKLAVLLCFGQYPLLGSSTVSSVFMERKLLSRTITVEMFLMRDYRDIKHSKVNLQYIDL